MLYQAAKAKEEREAQKKALKVERKTLRTKSQVLLLQRSTLSSNENKRTDCFVVKLHAYVYCVIHAHSFHPIEQQRTCACLCLWQEYGYFAADDAEKLKHMTDVEKMATLLSLLRLEELNKALTSGDSDTAKQGFASAVRHTVHQHH